MLFVRIAAAIFLCSFSAWGQTSPIETKFAELRKSPPRLREFLYRMPKGADLHNHLSGAVYAESFLAAAARDGLCVDLKLLRLVTGCAEGQVPARTTQTDNLLSRSLIDAFSMRNFVPSAGQSGHDHFFAAFDRFAVVDIGQFVAEVVQRAADQNESYLELMALAGAGPVANLGKATGLGDDFEATRRELEERGLPALVTAMRARVDLLDSARTRGLDCEHKPGSAACRVGVRYICQVLREFPPEQVFAQVMAGFALAASDPRVAAVNFVQPEDGIVSMRDYRLHMRMVEFARRVYPSVHVTLHAGEIWPGLVPPEGLQFHIREAVERGHAERIGHGTDVMFEKDAGGLLAEMKAKDIAVEISLSSSDLILGVRGDEHPFPVYRKFGVPVVLATDDEGVSRSNLTAEYERAVLTYHLNYGDLRQLVRNSLEFSFAPGMSYWRSAAYRAVVPACAAGRSSGGCREYLARNEKARLEADLEDRFVEFEKAVR